MGARVKAFGATTLRAEHVEEREGGVYLHFIGKEGIEHNHRIRDDGLAKMLLERKRNAAERDGRLFATSDDRLRNYTKENLDHGKFFPKDFRTKVANQLAVAEIRRLSESPPKTEKERKGRIKQVAEAVSHVLGNRSEEHTSELQSL